MSKILFPTDYSPSSEAVLHYAVALARDLSASLVVLHVAAHALGHAEQLALAAQAEADRSNLLDLAAQKNGAPRPVELEHRVVVGDPVEVILNVAKTDAVTLIVMGTKGRTGVRRLLMGSVAEAVARRAPCPVLTYREPDHFVAGGAAATAGHEPHPPAGAVSESLVTEAAASVSPTAEFDAWAFPDGPLVVTGPMDDSPAIALLTRAVTARATDIHLESCGSEMEVRFRIDGRIQRFCRLSREVGHALLTQLKVLSNLDISEPFAPQEGRLQLPGPLSAYDVRITTLRVATGDAASLRLLSHSRLIRHLDDLGLTERNLNLVKQMLRAGTGAILITGPSGAGKSTTAYSMLHAIDDGKRNIVSIEDPVEYLIPSIRQLSVDLRHGVTMTSGLRTLLRLDPDVVLIGEIRDPETAETAMRAASSGKHCFSTFHTRDVASTVTAMRDLHIDNRSLAGNLTGVVSQRLVRRVCQDCCRRAPLTDDERQLFDTHKISPPADSCHAVGCDHCRNTGYFDRIGVFEVVIPDRELMEAMVLGAREDNLREMLRQRGTPTLLDDGLLKVRDGLTTLDEVTRMSWVDV